MVPTTAPSNYTNAVPLESPRTKLSNNESHGESAAAPHLSANDELNVLVEQMIADFESSATWGEFMSKLRDPRGDFHADVKLLPHRTSHMMDLLRSGGSTVGTKTVNWSNVQTLNTLK
jgi:hypothetical protein